jgi:hypothetical protein
MSGVVVDVHGVLAAIRQGANHNTLNSILN